MLAYEVIWGHIDILVVAVRRLSRRWKVRKSTSGPQLYQPYEAKVTNSLISNTPPWESKPPWAKIRTFKLSFLKLPATTMFLIERLLLLLLLLQHPTAYTKPYHMEPTRLPHHLTRSPCLPSFRGLSTVSRWLCFYIPFVGLRIGQNVNTLWNNPIQVCIAYFNTPPCYAYLILPIAMVV